MSMASCAIPMTRTMDGLRLWWSSTWVAELLEGLEEAAEPLGRTLRPSVRNGNDDLAVLLIADGARGRIKPLAHAPRGDWHCGVRLILAPSFSRPKSASELEKRRYCPCPERPRTAADGRCLSARWSTHRHFHGNGRSELSCRGMQCSSLTSRTANVPTTT